MRLRLLLRAVFCVAWSVFAAELFLRVLHPVPMLPRFIQSMPYGIRGNMPLTDYWHTTPDYRIHVQTNAHGMRSDKPVSLEKPVGVKRIVMLGDSFGMGFGATADQAFLAQMEKKLVEAGQNVETLNLCVSGHGSAEELIELKERALNFNPDIVLVAWHHTDLDDNVRSGLFRLDEQGNLVRAADSYLPGTAIAERLFRNNAYRWLAGNCQLYTWSREKAGDLAQRALVTLRPAKPNLSRPSNHSAAGNGQKMKRGESYSDRLGISLVNEMKRITEERGAKFLLAIVPRRYNRTRFETDFPIEIDDDNLGIDIVNPLPKLEEHRGELIFWERSHFHFTPLGNRIFGEALANHILETGLLQ